jgi:hypothetical protein
MGSSLVDSTFEDSKEEEDPEDMQIMDSPDLIIKKLREEGASDVFELRYRKEKWTTTVLKSTMH